VVASQTLPHPPQLFGFVFRFTQVVPQRLSPVGQQRPNRAGRALFLTIGFAQSPLQQLMFVEHTVLFDLQPPARAGRGPMASVARSERANTAAVTRAICIVFSLGCLGWDRPQGAVVLTHTFTARQWKVARCVVTTGDTGHRHVAT
jgi:hypothetical protein